VLEAVAFGGVVLIAVYYLAKGESTQQVIPVLGLYAFAGYRLMPSLQRIFHSTMQLHFGQAILDTIYEELTAGMAPALDEHATAKMLPLRQTLELDGIEFAYPGAGRQSLHGVTLTLKANSTVGIVGPTGSGKSTLVDVMLGLLRPDRGEIRIDGAPLTAENLRAWQNNLGYVPQQIYLSDDTIVRNIAFGTPDAEIDMERVERAARTAQIYEFVTTELPEGFHTVAGERGVRLSGGERQRIGIARALYNDPAVLVFDEATSALDSRTEAMLMEAMKSLAHRKTLIIISHRRETLDWADAIVELRGGRVSISPQAPMQPGARIEGHT
jgi:ATP-binding cassette subfamily C protein